MGQEIPVSTESNLRLSSNVSLILEMPPDEDARIEDLARQIGGGKTDVFRHALGLLALAVRAREEGKRLGIIGRDGKIEAEITGL
jgi:hypothetical protein